MNERICRHICKKMSEIALTMYTDEELKATKDVADKNEFSRRARKRERKSAQLNQSSLFISLNLLVHITNGKDLKASVHHVKFIRECIQTYDDVNNSQMKKKESDFVKRGRKIYTIRT